MRTKIRSFAPLLAAAGVGRCHRDGAGRRGATPMRDHRSEHHAVPDQWQRTDRHLTHSRTTIGRWPWGGGLVIGFGGWGWGW